MLVTPSTPSPQYVHSAVRRVTHDEEVHCNASRNGNESWRNQHPTYKETTNKISHEMNHLLNGGEDIKSSDSCIRNPRPQCTDPVNSGRFHSHSRPQSLRFLDRCPSCAKEKSSGVENVAARAKILSIICPFTGNSPFRLCVNDICRSTPSKLTQINRLSIRFCRLLTLDSKIPA